MIFYTRHARRFFLTQNVCIACLTLCMGLWCISVWLGHTAWADAVCALVLAGETLVWWYMVRRNVEVGLWPDLRPYTVTIPKCWWGFLIP